MKTRKILFFRQKNDLMREKNILRKKDSDSWLPSSVPSDTAMLDKSGIFPGKYI